MSKTKMQSTKSTHLQRAHSLNDLHHSDDKANVLSMRSNSTGVLHRQNGKIAKRESTIMLEDTVKLKLALKQLAEDMKRLKEHNEELDRKIDYSNRQANLSSATTAIAGLAAFLIAFNWSTISPILYGVAEAIAPMLPIIGIGTGAAVVVAAAVGIVGFCAYQAYQHKDKITEFVKDKVFAPVKSALKGTGQVLKQSAQEATRKVGDTLTTTGHKLSGREDPLNIAESIRTVNRLNVEAITKQFKELFDKKSSTNLIQDILSKVRDRIDYKAGNAFVKHRDIDPKTADANLVAFRDRLYEDMLNFNKQKEYITNLNPNKLKNLLTNTSPVVFENRLALNKIFSEHYTMINKVITECTKAHLPSPQAKQEATELKQNTSLDPTQDIGSKKEFSGVEEYVNSLKPSPTLSRSHSTEDLMGFDIYYDCIDPSSITVNQHHNSSDSGISSPTHNSRTSSPVHTDQSATSSRTTSSENLNSHVSNVEFLTALRGKPSSYMKDPKAEPKEEPAVGVILSL